MNLCYEIGSRRYRRQLERSAGQPQAVFQTPENYWQWQFDTSAVYFKKFWDLTERMKGRRILDIGCGLGGRAAYLATQTAAQVVGCDINAEEVMRAERIADAKLDPASRARLRFVAVKEGEVPGAEPYDIVLLVDSIEHVRDPVAMLNVAYNCTRPGGICYFGTTGWYHYGGAHLLSVLPIPFVTVFFSDASIVDAVQRILKAPYYRRTMWDSEPPDKRWEGVRDLCDRPGEYLNKITVRGMKKAIRASRYEEGRLRVAGFSWQRAPVFRCLNFLARVPGVQEMYHSGCFGRLTRASSE